MPVRIVPRSKHSRPETKRTIPKIQGGAFWFGIAVLAGALLVGTQLRLGFESVDAIVGVSFHSEEERKFDAPFDAPSNDKNVISLSSSSSISTTRMKYRNHSESGGGNTFSNNTNTTAFALLDDWRRKRVQKHIYDTWFVNKQGEGDLIPNADAQGGPILDFVIAGFPKCGTTAMMRVLSKVTSMPPEMDVCAPPDQIVYYSYNNWAVDYGQDGKRKWMYHDSKPLKGSKCPNYLEGPELYRFAKKLPKTKLVIGLRHPVLWYQSYANMRWFREKYNGIPLEEWIAKDRLLNQSNWDNHLCHGGKKILFCVARSRFYLPLAHMGKTPLTLRERELLESELFQSKRRKGDFTTTLQNRKRPKTRPIIPKHDNDNNNTESSVTTGSSSVAIPNHVFVFESSQGREEYFYQELANFVQIDRSKLPPLNKDIYRKGNGLNTQILSQYQNESREELFDICQSKYDYIRKELLPIAHTLGEWLLKYLLPASLQREDLTIPNGTAFAQIVQGFGMDPCNGTLIRNDSDGEYYNHR